MIDEVTDWASIAVLVLLLVYKLQYLHTRWRSPGLWALLGTVFFPLLAMLSFGPAGYLWVGRMTGIPNLAWLLDTVCWLAFAASAVATALFWRYPVDVAWPRVRWTFAAYGLVTVLAVVLFSVSSVPEQRPVDFDVHYVSQPTVGILLMMTLTAKLAAKGGLACCCFAWAQDSGYAERPWLRRGLWLYGAFGFDLAIVAFMKIVSLSATWLGVHALNPMTAWIQSVSGPLGTCLLTAALMVPILGRHWPAVCRWTSRWRVFLTLRPLHRKLRSINPEVVLVVPGQRLDPHHRVRRMLMELSDWRWELVPLFDRAIAEAAEELGRERGLTGERLNVAVEAAQLKAALDAWDQGMRSVAGIAADWHSEDARDGTDLDAELTWWVQVARAVKQPLVVTKSNSLDAHSATTLGLGAQEAR